MSLRIDWSGRAIDYTEEELSLLVEVASTADPQTQGAHLAAFEKKFGAYLGADHVFAVNNCTNALDLAAILSRAGAGDEVVVPVHTFCATAIPFGRTGASLVWADIDPETLVVSAETIEARLTPRTKVVIVVHLYGMPCDMGPIVELCRERGIVLVEDCAQALGAEYRSRKVGTFGDFATFSFHGQKNITTLGEGGVLVVKDPDLAALVPGLRHNGVTPYPQREEYWRPAMGNVELDLEGVWPYNFCLSEAQAALGASLMDRLDALNEIRMDRAARFTRALAGYPELRFQAARPDCRNVYHLLVARYDGRAYGASSHDLIRLLHGKHGVKAIVQFYPLYRYPLFQKMGFGEADCPCADDFFDNMVSFPFQVWMDDGDFNYLIEATQRSLDELRGNV